MGVKFGSRGNKFKINLPTKKSFTCGAWRIYKYPGYKMSSWRLEDNAEIAGRVVHPGKTASAETTSSDTHMLSLLVRSALQFAA